MEKLNQAATDTDAWLKKNFKGKSSAKETMLAKLVGCLCFGLRLNMHHARIHGGRADLFGIKYNYFVAAVWGMCAWLNHTNTKLFTKEGEMNTIICGAFGALFALTAAGVNLGGFN